MRRTTWVRRAKRVLVLLLIGLLTAGLAYRGKHPRVVHGMPADKEGTTLPEDYRNWRLISVAHEEGNLNDLRAILGNDLAVTAYRNGVRPFPDGAAIVRIAWTYTPSQSNDVSFGRKQSFVAGDPTNIQLSVKDAHQFASTGGWGYAQFSPTHVPEAIKPEACSACHIAAKHQDFVFTQYAP